MFKFLVYRLFTNQLFVYYYVTASNESQTANDNDDGCDVSSQTSDTNKEQREQAAVLKHDDKPKKCQTKAGAGMFSDRCHCTYTVSDSLAHSRANSIKSGCQLQYLDCSNLYPVICGLHETSGFMKK